MKTRRLSTILCAAFCGAFALSSEADPVDPQIQQSGSGTVFLGNPQNPVTDPNTGITNNVTITGSVGTPTGTVTWSLYKGSCSGIGSPYYQAPPQTLVNGSATCNIPATQIGAGFYYWAVSYKSADPSQYYDSELLCSWNSTINKANPALSLQTAKSTGTLGETINVKAILPGGFQPNGNITFYVSEPNGANCGQKTLATVPFGSDGTVTIPFQPTQVGNYILTAAFAGDNLNNSASTNCGDTSVTFYPALTITAPANVYAGQSFDFTVTAYEDYPNISTGYNGTLHFTSSNGATLPAEATLTNGRGTFQAMLNDNGIQTITATDTNNTSRTATSSISAFPQSSFVVTSAADSDDGTCDGNLYFARGNQCRKQ